MKSRSPKRIQRRRTRGWRMPKGAVYVGRPTKFGNPFKLGRDGDLGTVLSSYECMLLDARARGQLDLSELRGKDLACWCKLPHAGAPDLCHGAILLRWANAPR